MSLLGFLKSGKVEEVTPSTKGSTGVRKQLQPNPAVVAIRLWKNGSVYPSQAAIDKFDLEYKKATVKKVPIEGKENLFKNEYDYPNGTGNGFDVIDTDAWGQYKGEGRMIFVAAVPKNAGKVDLFAQVNYDVEGTPKATVTEQGSNTFGEKVLLPMIKEVYGIELTEERDYVDLLILEQVGEGEEAVNVTEKFSKNILLVPKRVTRGDAKGKLDYSRREGVKVYLMAPEEVVNPEEEDSKMAPADYSEIESGAAVEMEG